MFGDPAAYECFMGRWSARLAPAFLEEVGLGDPGAVVDVGCGTGNLALAVAERWPSARVTGVDPSAVFVRDARRRAGSSQVRFQVGDALDLPLPGGSVDASLASFSSFDDYGDPFLDGQGAGGQFVASMAQGERSRVRDEVHGRLGDGPFVLPLGAWFARATVPGSGRRGDA